MFLLSVRQSALAPESWRITPRFEKNQRHPDLTILTKISKLGNISLDVLTAEEGAGSEPSTPSLVGELSTGGYKGKNDELSEIINLLKDDPEGRKSVLKLLRGQREIVEAMEYFQKPGGKKA